MLGVNLLLCKVSLQIESGIVATFIGSVCGVKIFYLYIQLNIALIHLSLSLFPPPPSLPQFVIIIQLHHPLLFQKTLETSAHLISLKYVFEYLQ